MYAYLETAKANTNVIFMVPMSVTLNVQNAFHIPEDQEAHNNNFFVPFIVFEHDHLVIDEKMNCKYQRTKNSGRYLENTYLDIKH
jgi:hypothetical protein